MERATDFVNEIAAYLEPYMNTDFMSVFGIERAVATFNTVNHRKVLMRYGAARVALITSDYVVKFDYDKDNVDVCGGCENEMENYQRARAGGYEYLLAKITRVEALGHYFYIMPRVRFIGKYDDFVGLTEEEEDWVNDNLYDMHVNNFGVMDGHTVIVDYAWWDGRSA